ncbi:transport-associated protein [Caballeronia temeraria]|uniref:Transport-associated protein n=1 Tax=Caballeronia temeraria TaxID=1777137 RepID=A0A158DVW2_9BURK|nr:BON domain-containing protein [Caballeronia temeraria]SAK98761.1 transport-associated protein [Caballeronia temeraria]
MNKTLSLTIAALVCFLILSNSALAQETAGPNVPASTSKTADRALAKSVRRALGRVKGLDPTRVYVRAKGGSVTLSGTVRDQAQIELAESTAKSVAGVSSVSNKMTIFNEGGK